MFSALAYGMAFDLILDGLDKIQTFREWGLAWRFFIWRGMPKDLRLCYHEALMGRWRQLRAESLRKTDV